jgi:hypothetical protein
MRNVFEKVGALSHTTTGNTGILHIMHTNGCSKANVSNSH